MPSRLTRTLRAAAAAAGVLALAACGSAAPQAVRLTPTPASGTVLEGIRYGSGGSQPLLLDACLPDDARSDGTPSATAPSTSASSAQQAGAPAVIVLHGGGFTTGDRSSGGTRTVCELMADRGVVGFAIDYRLVPSATYPAQVRDVQQAITWLRQPAQVRRFGIDPARIGLFGSSAGATIALQAATAGTGPLTTGTRVRAVVSLSGVADFVPGSADLGRTTPELEGLVLDYLDCAEASATACPRAAAGSAVRAVDASDPPMLLVNSEQEIVPRQQAQVMAAALQVADVPHRLLLRPGSAHGFAALDGTVRAAVVRFLEDTL